MKLTGVHLNKRLASSLICIILLLSSLLPFANAIAAPPSDDPDHGEVRLSAKDNGRQIELKEDQVLVISLEGNPSTGYTWEVEEADKRILHQVGKIEFEPEAHLRGAPGLLGAPGKQILRFKAMTTGQTTLRLVYHRPWEKDVEPARTFSLQVQGVGPFTDVKSPSLSKGSVRALRPTLDEAHAAGPSVESPVLSPSKDPIPVADQSQLGLPAAYNWCDQGGCTPVKDQGSCGSCWAFGTVGLLESNIKIHDGAVKDLSEQYLLSCNTDGWSCRGGWWAHDYHLNKTPPGEPDAGAVYEADFPYQAVGVPCGPAHTHHEKIDSWAYVGSEYGVPSVAAIKQAIYDHGPVSTAICVGPSFESYSGGVFEANEYCGGDVNHAVLLVGWNDNQGTNGIWYLRNSWGPGWGESGYMRIGYGISNVGYSANYIVYSGGSCQDAYEPDNAYTSAKLIAANGVAQHHTFHENGDVDWVKFTVTAGTAYTVTTSNLGANNDTVLYLYDTDGTTELASHEDCPLPGQASCINNWTAPVTGTYFISVSHFAVQGGCSGYGYDLAVVGGSRDKITEVFLPIIMKPSAGGGSLVNGDFENGSTGWVEYSQKGWDLILPAANLLAPPHSGSWAVWLGGDNDEISYIQQQVIVPASRPYLAYWHWIASEDLCGYDLGGVIVDDSIVADVYTLCLSTNTGGWVKHVVNLSAYAGQSISLQIRVETDDSFNSNLFVDDVSFQASASSVKDSPTPLDLKNAMPKSDKITPRDVDKGKGTEPEFLLRPQSRTTDGKILGKR